MIIEEYKNNSTTIKINDEFIGTKEENNEVINTIITLIVKKISEKSLNDL